MSDVHLTFLFQLNFGNVECGLWPVDLFMFYCQIIDISEPSVPTLIFIFKSWQIGYFRVNVYAIMKRGGVKNNYPNTKIQPK